MGSAAALRAAPSVVCPSWAGEPLPLPLPLLPAGGDRTKSRDVAERAGEARGEQPAAAGGVWGSLRVPARLRDSAVLAAVPAGRCGETCGGRGKVLSGPLAPRSAKLQGLERIRLSRGGSGTFSSSLRRCIL